MNRHTGYEPLYTLKSVSRDIWIADGGWIKFYGLPFPTRMTVVRLADGGVWVHSPIANLNELANAVAKLGPVRHLVAPNWIHYAWMPEWKGHFPEATTWGSPGVEKRAASRGTMLRLNHTLGAKAPNDWCDDIDQFLADSWLHREVVFFHRMSRTLILTDLIENFELEKMPRWTHALLKIGAVCDPDGRMPRDMALSFALKPKHRAELIGTLIDWNPKQIILAHGRWYDRDGTSELRRAFRVG